MVDHPDPPQIRARAINAHGSSFQTSLRSYPSSFRGHVHGLRCTRHVSLQRLFETTSPSLRGVPSVRFPRFNGTTGRSDSLPLVSPHFVAFAWRYHRFVLGSSPPARDRAADHPGVGKPEPRPAVTTEMAGSLRFPSDPHVPTPCSRTPVGPMHARPLRRLDTAPACVYNGGSRKEYFEAQSHGIGTRCLRFAVKVSFPHARLASGCWPSSAGRDSFNPQGCNEKFQSSSLFLLSRAYLTLRHPSVSEQRRVEMWRGGLGLA